MIFWLLTFYTFVILFSYASIDPTSESVKITKWEFCEGCKETVNLFSIVASTELIEMQNKGKLSSIVLAVQNLVNGICDNAYLNKFNKFVKHSCIKIMDEHQHPFLKQFEGSVSSTIVTQNSVVLNQKRKVYFQFEYNLF
jgi:hypothetical protein